MAAANSNMVVQALKCPVCGAQVKPYARECEYCGTALVIVSVGAAQAQTADSQALTDSLAKWREVLAHDPNNAAANYALGVAFLHQGLRDAALAYLQRATQAAPEVAVYHYNYALALFNDGEEMGLDQMNTVSTEIDYASRLDPNFPEARAFRQFFVACGLRPANPKGAAAALEAAVQVCPDIGIFYAWLGACYADVQNYAAARPACRKAIELDPRLGEPHITLSAMAYETGNVDEGMQWASKAVALFRTPIYQAFAIYHLGVGYEEKKNYATAEQHYRRAMELSPQFGSVYRHLCLVCCMTRRPDEGIKYGHKALELAPSSQTKASANDSLGLCYHQLGNHAAAEKSFREAVALNPKLGQAYDHLCSLYYAWKKYDKGIEYGQKAVELIKSPPEDLALAYNNLGMCLWGKGQREQAGQMLQKAIAISPHNPGFQANLQALQQKR